jgi:hypothetical protein
MKPTLPSFDHCLPITKPLSWLQNTFGAVSHFTCLLLLSQVQQTLSVLSEKTLNDLALVKFQDYHTFKGGISLNDYGYVFDSDLEEDNEEGEEIEEIVKDSRWIYLTWLAGVYFKIF